MIKVENKVYYSLNIGRKVDVDYFFDSTLSLSVYRTISDIKRLIDILKVSNIVDFQILKLEITGDIEKKNSQENINEYAANGVIKVIEIMDKDKIY